MTACIGKDCPPIDNQPREARPGTMLCGRCSRRLERDLAEMPARLDVLRALLGGHHTPRRSDRGGGETPVPMNVGVFDLLQHIPAVLGSWAQLVCEERSLRGPDSDERVPGWLLAQVDWLVEQQWVDDLCDELSGLVRAAEVFIRSRPHRDRLEPPCPSCGARELGRWDGTAQVDCASCGRVWSETHLPAFVRLALDDSGGCLTAAEAASRLGVSVRAVQYLAADGRVRKLGTVDGKARYSTRDVETLLEEGAA